MSWTAKFECCCMGQIDKKIIDWDGGQINDDPSMRKHFSLLFLPCLQPGVNILARIQECFPKANFEI